MFSKPLAFVLLALACLTAAAGGAYLATRHNLADAVALNARNTHPDGPAALATSPAKSAQPEAVAETEAPVTARREDARREEKKEDTKAEAAASGPARPETRKPEVAKTKTVKPEPVAARPAAEMRPASPPAETPATPRQVQRTVPLPSAGSPIPSAETPAPVPAAPAVAAPAQPKPIDPVKPVEDAQPEPARTPQLDELVVPAAAVIGLQVETSLSSERTRLEDRVDARVSRDVMAAGRVAIPAGSRVIGSVTTVERGGKLKDQARLGIRFHTLVLADGTQVPLHTDPVYRFGEEPAAASSKKIGGAAIGGAILGAILGGGKGAAIGGATGAAGGTAAVMAGDRSPATLRPGEYLNVKLSSPATITVERRE